MDSFLADSPFGRSIFDSDILEAVEFLDDWEERYGYFIDLGKSLPALPETLKTESNLVRGCQSQVWLTHTLGDDGKLWFGVDSDALIVRGLAALVLAALNGKSPQQLLAYDMAGYFERLNLLKHLSPTRGNGVQAMVQRILATASDNAH